MLKALAIIAIVAAIALFAALIGMLALYSSDQSEPYDQEQPATAESANSQNSGAASNKTTSDRGNKREQKKAWYYSFAERPTDWLLVLFNGLLVLATVALFVSGERSVEVARDTAKAAQQSAKAASDANETTRAQISAYLVIAKEPQSTIQVSTEGAVTLVLYLVNTGESTAHEAYVAVQVGLQPNGIPQPLFSPGITTGPNEVTTKQPVRVSPGGDQLKVPQLLLQAAQKNGGFVWVQGNVSFRTIFQNEIASQPFRLMILIGPGGRDLGNPIPLAPGFDFSRAGLPGTQLAPQQPAQ
jgi:hypothetical protein